VQEEENGSVIFLPEVVRERNIIESNTSDELAALVETQIPINPVILKVKSHHLTLVPTLPVKNQAAIQQDKFLPKKACRHCHSKNIERRRRTGWEKIVLPILRKYRYLCYTCGRDFYAKRAAS
jgi:hypothetical protein